MEDELWMLESRLQQFKAKLLKYRKLRTSLESRIVALEIEIAMKKKELKQQKKDETIL